MRINLLLKRHNDAGPAVSYLKNLPCKSDNIEQDDAGELRQVQETHAQLRKACRARATCEGVSIDSRPAFYKD